MDGGHDKWFGWWEYGIHCISNIVLHTVSEKLKCLEHWSINCWSQYSWDKIFKCEKEMHKDYTSMEAMVRSFGDFGVKCEVCDKLDPYGSFSGASCKPRKFIQWLLKIDLNSEDL